MKKYLLSLLTLTLLFCEASFTGGGMAFAATTISGDCGTGITATWDASTTTITISGSGSMKNWTSSYTGRPWQSYASTATKIVIENGVTSVGNYAFKDFSELTSIELANSITSIGTYAFNTCSKLAGKITLPENLTSLGSYCFQSCANITGVTLNSSLITINTHAFDQCSKLEGGIVIPKTVTGLSSYAFADTKLSKLSFEKGINLTSIGSNAFKGTKIGTVTIPASVTSLDGFNGCASLESVLFEEGSHLNIISSSAFNGCTKLPYLELPEGLTQIQASAFYGCTKLGGIAIPSTVTDIKNSAFYNCNKLLSIIMYGAKPTLGSTDPFTSVTKSIPVLVPADQLSSYSSSSWGGFSNFVTGSFTGDWSGTSSSVSFTFTPSTGEISFSGTGSMKSGSGSIWHYYPYLVTDITIGSGITTINTSNFENCTDQVVVNLPSSITAINSSAFNYSAKIKRVNYAGTKEQWATINFGSLTANPAYYAKELYIKNPSTGDYELLTDGYFGDGVISISNYAFRRNESLTQISISGNTTIGAESFIECLVPVEVRGGYATGSCGANITYVLNDGVLTLTGSGAMTTYDNSSNKAPWYNKRTVIQRVIVGEGITTLSNYAFYDLYSLQNIELPSTLQTIGYNSVGNSPFLQYLTIPASVTDMGDYAFGKSSKIKEILCLGTTPPNLVGYAPYTGSTQYRQFGGTSLSSANICVPASAYNTYGEANGWSLYNGLDKPRTNYAKSVWGYCGADAGGANLMGKYTFSSHILSITGDGGMCNYTSSSHAPWYDWRAEIESILYDGDIISIGNYAYYGCTNIDEFSIPESVTSIGGHAFYNCSGLPTTITIPSQIIYMGDMVFTGCSVTAVVWNATNYTSTNLSAGTNPFWSNRSSITSFTFGSNVEYIPSYLCYGMSHNSFTSVTIPASVTGMGTNIFQGCSKIRTINWNARNCADFTSETAPFETIKTAITSFNFGHGVRHIPAYLCKDMNNITYPYSSTYGVTIPTSVKSIGTDAFDGCTNFNRTDFKGSNSYAITYVDDWGQINFANEKANPLYYSGHLYVVIPPSGQSTPGPGEVRTPVFKDTTTYINSYAFVNCSSITSVTFGSSMSSIAANAFAGCTGITSVTSNAVDAPTIASNSFPASVKSSAPLTLVSCESKADYLEDANWNFTTIYPNKVQFDLKGHGSKISSQCVEESEAVSEPSDPSADYYTFGGWFDNENCEGDAFDFSSEISTDLTLYAKWTENVFSFADTDDDNSKIAAAYNKLASSITIRRTIWKDGYYNSMCLPFSLSADQIADSPLAGYKALKRLSEATVTGDGSERVLNIQLEPISEITAGEPFFISYDAGENIVNPVFDDVMVTTTAPSTIVEGDVTCRGLFYKNDIGAETTNLFVGENNTLYWPKEGKSTMKGFRAYFSINPASSAVARGMRVRFVDRMPTGVEKVSGERLDVNGKKILYEGQLFILRDGKTYNAQGALMK